MHVSCHLELIEIGRQVHKEFCHKNNILKHKSFHSNIATNLTKF